MKIWLIEDDPETAAQILTGLQRIDKALIVNTYHSGFDCYQANRGMAGPDIIFMDVAAIGAGIGNPLYVMARTLIPIIENFGDHAGIVFYSAMGPQFLKDIKAEIEEVKPGGDFRFLTMGRNFIQELTEILTEVRSAPAGSASKS